MPRFIFTDGTSRPVSFAKAAEARSYIDDDTPGHRLSDLNPEKRAEVEAFLQKIADIDFSDMPRVQHSTRANRPAVKEALERTDLKGKAKFDAVKRAWRGTDGD